MNSSEVKTDSDISSTEKNPEMKTFNIDYNDTDDCQSGKKADTKNTFEIESTNLKVRKNNKNYSKTFKCDKCEKRYTWFSGLSNHKRFVHSKLKET